MQKFVAFNCICFLVIIIVAFTDDCVDSSDALPSSLLTTVRVKRLALSTVKSLLTLSVT